MHIPFLDPTAPYRHHREAIDTAVQEVLAGGVYTMGVEGARLEATLAESMGSGYAVCVGSGHDALLLALHALEIGAGDEVITVAHAPMGTTAAIMHSGARPVFVDVEPRTGTLDPRALDSALTARTKGIVPVHLDGHPANMLPVQTFARQHKLHVVEECSLAAGARYHGQSVGTMGKCGVLGFHSRDSLGGLGDGGAIITDDAVLAQRLRHLRQMPAESPNGAMLLAHDSRLNEVQAAILNVLLESLADEVDRRRQLAAAYSQLLTDVSFPLLLPIPLPGCRPSYLYYRVQTLERDALKEHLRRQGIETVATLKTPLHLQPALSSLGYKHGDLPVTEQLSALLLALPIYPTLTLDQLEIICRLIRQFRPAG